MKLPSATSFKQRTPQLLFAALLAAGAAPSFAADAVAEVRADQVVDTLESTFGVHAGQRRNHIKGTCAAGEFVGTPAAATLSSSALFSGKAVPVVARFSLAGGNPNLPDAARNARGMALELRLPGGALQHITMLNTPVFGAAHPDTFNAMLVASKPDPATGKPNPDKLKDFFASHPDAMSQAAFLQENGPPAQYYNSAFYSVHTFKFIDAKKAEHMVRWRFVPHDGEQQLSAAALKTAPHDFLEAGLIARAAKAPVQWDMIVYEGEPGDPVDNATLAWPEARRHFKAGTLTIAQATPQAGAECEKINFDPLVMADGIAPTSDPILLFRSPAYAFSFAKRLSGQ
ncbi:catalase family peroxidase [Rugamonas sp.]|uniref:catalase family peroxidase n=1 Tax=Rugamonas sp. TaxID=1926287 RepID=UPI0025F0BD08|nr:catalase family peroxidase [Rugamonas sp.]